MPKSSSVYGRGQPHRIWVRNSRGSS
jgi:hypothetical protein